MADTHFGVPQPSLPDTLCPMRILLAFCAATLIAVIADRANALTGAPAPQVGPFHQACTTLPFEAIKKARDIGATRWEV
jgi:hypothetical protein